MNKVKDPAFSSEALGKGIAVIPENGKITAPVAGTVAAVYPTLHAYGIVSENQEEFLIHIGIDTVKLDGKYFKSHVKTGDIVMPGELIAAIEIDEIKKAGFDPTVIIVDTSGGSERKMTLLREGSVSSQEDLLLIESL